MDLEELVANWHTAVNQRHLEDIASIVADDVLLSGPKGDTAGRGAVEDWVQRSGISLVGMNWHPILATEMVVEEGATWPGSADTIQVFTRHQSDGEVLTSIRRFDSLADALRTK